MPQFLPYECIRCMKITRHDILKRVNGRVTVILRLSCTKCTTLPFQVELNRELTEPNIVSDHYSLDDEPGDHTIFH